MKPDADEGSCNPSSNPTFEEILSLSRRQVVQCGLGALAAAMVGGPKELLAQSGGTALLGFTSVPLTGEDRVIVPRGYSATVLYAWGDPVSNGPEWDNQALDTWVDQEQQAGMHHDGMYFFPLPYGSASNDRGLLAINHEYVDHGLLFRDATANWSADKVRKSQAAHGISVIEVVNQGGEWQVVRPSQYARRITAYTPMRVSGPAAGDPAMRTAADPSGMTVLGSVNNCANGFTPWGTYLSCEENFNNYFVYRTTPIPSNYSRYGINATSGVGNRWFEFDARFDAAVHGNEPNRFGWVVEIDPFDPTHTPVKRTALGRMKHEGVAPAIAPDGRVVLYMGDDEAFNYIYKFVSRDPWNPSSRSANTNLLDDGTLYVAQFGAGGVGRWIALVFGENGLDPAGGFTSQADVLIRTRQAADRVGATRMDRPEWITVMPSNRDVYVTLTNNTGRGTGTNEGATPPNPRTDNSFGHIIRWREEGSDPTATSFQWNIFALAGDRANSNAAKRGNINGDTYGSPDGIWGDSRGVLWIQTDISTSALGTGDYINIPTNMMLAADPTTGLTRRFLTGPRGCEITGITATPDLRTLFINVQHPGEPASGDTNPNATGAISTWPDGPGVGRPRAATVVIRKDDGGVIGT
jgi:secreted PhoX family phosphatase